MLRGLKLQLGALMLGVGKLLLDLGATLLGAGKLLLQQLTQLL